MQVRTHVPEAKGDKGTRLGYQQMPQDQTEPAILASTESAATTQVPNRAGLFTTVDCGWYNGLHTQSAHVASDLRTEPGKGLCPSN